VKFVDFQASSTFNFNGQIMSACEKCRMDYEERKPPCDTCRVVLAEENEEAAEIYMLCRDQIITRHNGKYDTVVDISIPAVMGAMDIYPGGIKDRWTVLNRVRKLFFQMRENEGEDG
jgi:hypothetical protein